MHTHTGDIEAAKPLLIAIAANAAGSLHEVLGLVSLSLSIVYTLYKFYKEKKD
jgi:hypothetical protein